jgi:hypothetical protein
MILPLTDADDFLFKDPNSIIPLYFINQYMYECVMALENSNNDTKVLRYPSIVENMLLNVYTWLYDGLYNDEEEDVEREREIENLIIPYSLLESIHYLFTFPYFSSKFKEMVLIDEHQIVQITPSSTKGFVKMTFVICGIYGNN